MPEEFRDVTHYPGYRVSTEGRVQSKRHKNGLPAGEWRDLTPVLDGHGYPQVRLSNANGPKWWFVSRLVLTVFVRPAEPGEVARHMLTNDPLDSRLVNLAWGTQADNCEDKYRHGTDQTGDRHPSKVKRARLLRQVAAAVDNANCTKD